MTEGVSEKTLAFGLLMESAQAHQQMAETQLAQLRRHTQELDDVVRDEIRRTLVDELKLLKTEANGTVHALQRMRRVSSWRAAASTIGLTMMCALIPVGVGRWILPSNAEIAALQAQRERLNMNIAALEQKGARIELKHCGADARLCVQVDVKAPRFGEHGDYYIVAGY